MSKDPAFLFYSDNFMSGTMFFTDEQTGKYIRLLCAQHLTGHLEEEHMLKICKTHDKDIWGKFTKDEAGKYYNIRLENEILRRKAYSESRSGNRKGKTKKIRKTYVKHMGTGNGTITINEFLKYCKEILNEKYPSLEFSLTAKFNQWNEAGWKDGNGSPIKNWKTKIQNTIPYLKPMQNGKHAINSADLNLSEGETVDYEKL